jgi:predicted RND superfamily exporter protein
MRIHAGLPDVGGRSFLEFTTRAQAELERRLAGLDIRTHATGTPLLAYAGVNRITSDLRRSFALVFVVVLGLIALLFRSPWPALISVLPNGLPLALGYATIGLFGAVLDPLAAVILTLALGIAVDDTLHIMVRTREELRPGIAVDEALRRALDHSGRAVAVTSVVIAGGLALNLMASFPPLQMLGLLGAVVISLALLADLLVLPALLVLLRGRGLGVTPRPAHANHRRSP